MNPTMAETSAVASIEIPMLHVATRGKRFLNLIIDGTSVSLISMCVSTIYFNVVAGNSFDSFELFVIGISLLNTPVMVCYYIFFEFFFQRTIGKFVTGTKVFRKDGKKPTFLQVLDRTFGKFIPFEVFSFLGGKYPIGWHDSLSKTLVVPAAYTSADVQSIDMSKMNKDSSIFKVILIFIVTIMAIGLVSSIVLATLATMKNGSIKTDIETKAYLDNFQTKVAPRFHVVNNGSYGTNAEQCGRGGLFSQGNIGKVLVDGKPFLCVAQDDFYQFSMNLPESGEKYCLDSKGFSGIGAPFTTGCKEFGKQYNAADLGL